MLAGRGSIGCQALVCSGACIRRFEVFAGKIGLRLVAPACCGVLVLLDSLVALVKQVEHLSGIELGATL